jgi:hypothetical protein
MKTRLLVLAGLLCALSSQAQNSTRELWTWTDANGVTHFSDRPVPGARRMELANTTTPAPATAPSAAAAAAAPGAPQNRPAAAQYRSLEIWEPEQDASFFGADVAVNVRMRVDPDLAPGHRLLLFLDGQRVEGATDALEHTLTGLPRGAHSLSAVIRDEGSTELFRSQPRVFHVRQPTINPPAAVGPNLRPRPAPAPAPRPNTPK